MKTQTFRHRIFVEIKKLKKIRKLPEFPLDAMPRHKQHEGQMRRIEIAAVKDVRMFAHMIADGEIAAEFDAVLCRVRHLHSSGYYFGVLPILAQSNIPEIKSKIEWYMNIHFDNNQDVHSYENGGTTNDQR